MSPLTAFLTGLTTGGLTCMAVQGGLLFGLLAKRRESDEQLRGWQRTVLPVSAFLVAKLVIYTLLGLGLGWLGQKIQLTQTARIVLQTVAGAFMILAGIRLIVPSWLPWLNINPPASVRRFIRRSSQSEAMVAPAILGLLTILIPCGTTQAMEVAAVATGSPFQAAAILFAFVLGTAPLFLIIGVLAKGTTIFQTRLQWVAASLVIGLGIYALNGVLVMIDSPYALQRQAAAFENIFLGGQREIEAATDDVATINVLNNGYNPSALTVQAGKTIQLKLVTNKVYACTSVFRIPKLQIEKTLPATGETLVTATFPAPGTYSFSCGMGMYTGTITAI